MDSGSLSEGGFPMQAELTRRLGVITQVTLPANTSLSGLLFETGTDDTMTGAVESPSRGISTRTRAGASLP
jgi:hypothetical protein